MTKVFPNGSGAKVTDAIYARGTSCDRDYLKKVISENGHAMIGVYGENQSFKDYKSGVEESCPRKHGLIQSFYNI